MKKAPENLKIWFKKVMFKKSSAAATWGHLIFEAKKIYETIKKSIYDPLNYFNQFTVSRYNNQRPSGFLIVISNF